MVAKQPSRQGKRKVCATFLFLSIAAVAFPPICMYIYTYIYLRGCHLKAASVKIKQLGGEAMNEIKLLKLVKYAKRRGLTASRDAFPLCCFVLARYKGGDSERKMWNKVALVFHVGN